MCDFLECNPRVYAVRNDYQIIVNLNKNAVCYLEIGDKKYYENCGGVFATERRIHKFVIPQKTLDAECAYTVVFREVFERKMYHSDTSAEIHKTTFAFSHVTKETGIKCICIGDIHGQFDRFGKLIKRVDDADVIFVNGDWGESFSEDFMTETDRFFGDISGGRIPMVIARGNHDVRGRYSEDILSHIASDGDKTYYPYTLGPIGGVIVDCGEDKDDSHPEYGGVNYFEYYRHRESVEFAKMRMPKSKYTIAMCHTPFMLKCCAYPNDYDNESLKSFSRTLNRMKPDIMLCAHRHVFDYHAVGDNSGCAFEHNYPFFLTSQQGGDDVRRGITYFVLNDTRADFYKVVEGQETEKWISVPLV